ncbi:MAG: AMP-binding protein, partial [Bacteroidota bacterium]|nr:AMP-binding protein [Bacteroidota bacterium]
MICNDNLEKAAIITKTKSVSYRELLENIGAYSELYRIKGYSKVAIYAENREEWIYAFYSIWQNDAIPVPVD